eukprot:jgi/Tetstr1/445880/TSEL_033519.t1
MLVVLLLQVDGGLNGLPVDALEAARPIVITSHGPVQAYSPFHAQHSLTGRPASIPYMEDFSPLADSREAALELRAQQDTMPDRLGLLRNPSNGVWEPTPVGPHLELIVDLQSGNFRAPKEKLIYRAG